MTTPKQGSAPAKPQAAKAAPAPAAKPESAASKASRIAPLNLSALSFNEAAAPVRKPSRTRDPKIYAPLIKQLNESWSKQVNGKGSGKAVTVPTVNAKQLSSMIRTATDLLAEQRNEPIGVTIVTEEHSNGTTTVRFAAKKRRESHK